MTITSNNKIIMNEKDNEDKKAMAKKVMIKEKS
jgi:hypothetical protein